MKTNKINEILCETFKISHEQVKEDLGMNDIANWDSITHMNLIVSLENEFEVELTGDEIAEMITFDKIRSTMANHF